MRLLSRSTPYGKNAPLSNGKRTPHTGENINDHLKLATQVQPENVEKRRAHKGGEQQIYVLHTDNKKQTP